jgi:hypothetical protein
MPGFSLKDDPVHDLGGRRRVVDQGDCLPGNHRRHVEVTSLAGFGVAVGLLLLVFQEFRLTSIPVLGMSIADHPSCIRLGPDVASGDVEHDAAKRVVATGLDDPLLGLWMAVGLL